MRKRIALECCCDEAEQKCDWCLAGTTPTDLLVEASGFTGDNSELLNRNFSSFTYGLLFPGGPIPACGYRRDLTETFAYRVEGGYYQQQPGTGPITFDLRFLLSPSPFYDGIFRYEFGSTPPVDCLFPDQTQLTFVNDTQDPGGPFGSNATVLVTPIR